MLDRPRFDEWEKRADGRDVCDVLDVEQDIRPLADTCMDYGCKVLMIKCGAPGMYLRIASAETLKKTSPAVGLDSATWAEQDFFEKSYVPDRILSGTGAGDTSIAAFLTAVLDRYGSEWAMHFATGTGASCITELDAISGLLTFPELKKKLQLAGRKTHSAKYVNANVV